MGTRIIGDRVTRGDAAIGIDATGEVYATLGGEPVRFEDGAEVVREGTLDGHRLRSTLRMDTVGPRGRQAARFIYTGEVVAADPRVSGWHHLVCWVPLPGQERRFEVADDRFESVHHAQWRRRARLIVLAVALLAIVAALLWIPRGVP